MRSVYGDICPSCQKLMNFGIGGGPYATIDHVIPRSLGGTNQEDNLQLLCKECNEEKADRLDPRVDGGPLPLPPPLPRPLPVTKDTISRFWDLRCGLCGRLEPCLVHEKDNTRHSG